MRRGVLGIALCFASVICGASNAQVVTLYSVSWVPGYGAYTLGTSGAFQGEQSPSSLIFGTLPPSGVPIAAVAVEQHILHPGESVPLPRYADGSLAAENEIFWTVHLWEARFGPPQPGTEPRFDKYLAATETRGGDLVTVAFSGRQYGGGSGRINHVSDPPIVANNVDVMVTVVATRLAGPTPNKSKSWGEVKATYR